MRRQSNKFRFAVLITLTIALGCTVLFQYIVDPYWIFDSRLYDRFNKVKPSLETTTRSIKPVWYNWSRSPTVFLGTSTTEAGLSPDMLLAKKKAFNMSFGGASLQEIKSAADFVIGLGAKRLIIGLDYHLFTNENHTKDKTQFLNAKKSTPLLALASLSISKKAIATAFDTIAENRHPSAETTVTNVRQLTTRSGFRPPSFYHSAITKAGGYSKFFVKSTASQARKQLYHRACSDAEPNLSEFALQQLNLLQQILYTAQKNDVEVTLFIPPYHIYFQAFMSHFGRYQNYLSFKERLVSITSAFERNTSVLDFNYISQRSYILPIEKAPNERLDFFYDANHYKPALGQFVLDDLFSNKPNLSWAIQLKSSNINDFVKEQRRQVVNFYDHIQKQKSEHVMLHNIIYELQLDGYEQCTFL